MTMARYFVGLGWLAVYGGVMVAVESPWTFLVGFIGGLGYGVIFLPVVRRRTSSSVGVSDG